jgi:MtN3 and saliva related transmembrane protein
MANVIGIAAGSLTTLSLVPQVVKTWRSQSAKDLSLSMLLVFIAGVALWETYGLMLGASPIIVANAFTLALLLAMLVMKMKYSR